MNVLRDRFEALERTMSEPAFDTNDLRRRQARRAARQRTSATVLGGALTIALGAALVAVGAGVRSSDVAGPTSASTDAPTIRGPGLRAPLAGVPDAPAESIVFTSVDHATGAQAIFTVDPRTGAVSMVPGTGHGGPEEPAWSPDRTSIAFSFEGREGIFVMDADGSSVRRVTGFGTSPQWSPDGTKILFSATAAADEALPDERHGIFVVDADGTGLVRLGDGEWPTWSPDGDEIAFVTARGELSIMRADGSDARRLDVYGGRPDWSPDGSRIAFVGGCGSVGGREPICVVDVDGADVRSLTSAHGYFLDPSWSPDGSMIAFGYDVPEWEKTVPPSECCPSEYEVYVMYADGSGVHRLTDLATPVFRVSATSPDWG